MSESTPISFMTIALVATVMMTLWLLSFVGLYYLLRNALMLEVRDLLRLWLLATTGREPIQIGVPDFGVDASAVLPSDNRPENYDPILNA